MAAAEAALAVLLGQLADAVFADPLRGHPVAAFGRAAAGAERLLYRDSRRRGALHEAGALAAVAGVGGAARVAARRVVGPAGAIAVTAAATWIALGGASLARTGTRIADLLDAGDIDGARALLPWLCGRDPSVLDAPGLTRAALESIAENTSDAQVAPLLFAAAGAPAVLVYRAANTLDAMVGHRSPRYRRFGWAAARCDDVLNYVPARVTGAAAAACAPMVGGDPAAALRAWRRDAARHPSPNAGVAEAAFAGALGVTLGGPTQYAHDLEIRPTLGDGRTPTVTDLRRAVRLSQAVSVLTGAVVVAGLAAVSVRSACRTGRRAGPRV